MPVLSLFRATTVFFIYMLPAAAVEIRMKPESDGTYPSLQTACLKIEPKMTLSELNDIFRENLSFGANTILSGMSKCVINVTSHDRTFKVNYIEGRITKQFSKRDFEVILRDRIQRWGVPQTVVFNLNEVQTLSYGAKISSWMKDSGVASWSIPPAITRKLTVVRTHSDNVLGIYDEMIDKDQSKDYLSKFHLPSFVPGFLKIDP